MARTTGPLFSLDASGSVGGAITFSKWKGRNYVRRRIIPSNPKSGAQVGRRAMFAFLSKAWTDLTAPEQASWQTIADQVVASPFNAYIKANMKRWHNFFTPTQDDPAGEAGSGSDNDLTAAVWEHNRIKLTASGTALAEAWGYAIFAETTESVTAAVGNCVLVVPDTTIASHSHYWTPHTGIIGADWFFVTINFSDDGAKETQGSEQAT